MTTFTQQEFTFSVIHYLSSDPNLCTDARQVLNLMQFNLGCVTMYTAAMQTLIRIYATILQLKSCLSKSGYASAKFSGVVQQHEKKVLSGTSSFERLKNPQILMPSD